MPASRCYHQQLAPHYVLDRRHFAHAVGEIVGVVRQLAPSARHIVAARGHNPSSRHSLGPCDRHHWALTRDVGLRDGDIARMTWRRTVRGVTLWRCGNVVAHSRHASPLLRHHTLVARRLFPPCGNAGALRNHLDGADGHAASIHVHTPRDRCHIAPLRGQLTRGRGQLARGRGQLARGRGQLARGRGQLAPHRGETTPLRRHTRNDRR